MILADSTTIITTSTTTKLATTITSTEKISISATVPFTMPSQESNSHKQGCDVAEKSCECPQTVAANCGILSLLSERLVLTPKWFKWKTYLSHLRTSLIRHHFY